MISIKMDVFCSLIVFQMIGLSYSQAYPIFGTKRYHGSSGIPPPPPPPAAPIYNPIPQYYENAGYDPAYMSQSAYPYNDEGNFYYMPVRHEQQPSPVRTNYRTYGMPTYRGEYKPTPYYYSHGPTYSYYDDHMESTNPLDDLHEEMLQEDERERQRDMYPVGQETWYENSVRQDSLANANAAFLRNLIAYNKQLNAAKEDPQFETNDEFDDYLNDDESYEQQKFDQQSEEIPYYSNNNYNSKTKPQYPSAVNQKINEIDDDDVRELKALAHKHSPVPSYHNTNSYNNQQQQQQYIDDHIPDVHNSWDGHDSQSAYNQQQQPQYEADPEYDDSWINWDSKRSAAATKKDTSIFAFTDRKPHHELEKAQKFIKVLTSTVAPPPSSSAKQQKTKSPRKFTSTTVLTTPTSIQAGDDDDLEALLKKLSGQKEVVLPRPASPVRHPSTTAQSDPVASLENLAREADEEKRPSSKDSMYDTLKQLLALEHHHDKDSNVDSTRLQKRSSYTANEESLIQELNGLKRISV